jgi:hypothetical protein
MGRGLSIDHRRKHVPRNGMPPSIGTEHQALVAVAVSRLQIRQPPVFPFNGRFSYGAVHPADASLGQLVVGGDCVVGRCRRPLTENNTKRTTTGMDST